MTRKAREIQSDIDRLEAEHSKAIADKSGSFAVSASILGITAALSDLYSEMDAVTKGESP